MATGQLGNISNGATGGNMRTGQLGNCGNDETAVTPMARTPAATEYRRWRAVRVVRVAAWLEGCEANDN